MKYSVTYADPYRDRFLYFDHREIHTIDPADHRLLPMYFYENAPPPLLILLLPVTQMKSLVIRNLRFIYFFSSLLYISNVMPKTLVFRGYASVIDIFQTTIWHYDVVEKFINFQFKNTLGIASRNVKRLHYRCCGKKDAILGINSYD